MNVLIYEPAVSGHHAQYLRHIIEAVADVGANAIVAVSESAQESDEYRIHLADVSNQADWVRLAGVYASNGLSKALCHLDACHETALAVKAEHVIIPYADGLAQGLGLRRLFSALSRRRCPLSYQMEGLLFRGGFAYPATSQLKALQHRLSQRLILSGGWAKMHVLDPWACDVLRGNAMGDCDVYRTMPEPIEAPPLISRQDARQSLSIPEAGRYLCCAGTLNRRRGVDRVIRAMAGSRRIFSEFDRLLIAGPTSSEIRTIIESEGRSLMERSQLIWINRVLSPDELGKVLVASDVSLATYPNHVGSASMVIRSAAANRPVLGTGMGWIGRAINTFNLGWVADPNNTASLATAFAQALDRSSSWEASDATRRFIKYHTVENFKAHWSQQLRRRLGRPAASSLGDWQAVFG